MAHPLWQGSIAHRVRLSSGLILFVFAFFHFLNVGMGLVSTEAMENMQHIRTRFTQNPIGGPILLAALLSHMGLAIWSIASRRHLQFSLTSGLQLALGLLIPLQLFQHVVHMSLGDRLFDVDDDMPFLILRLWGSNEIWEQSALLLAVWIHSCIGLHMWLRMTRLWQKLVPYLIGVAVLLPAFALAGLLTEGRSISDLYYNQGFAEAMQETWHWPTAEENAMLQGISNGIGAVFWGLVALAVAVFALRRALRRRRSVRITYTEGPTITGETGQTLLEMSQQADVPHAALCGGKGRCTTCRVAIIEGGETLDPPSVAEARALTAVKAGPTTRLACQITPTAPLTLTRMYRPERGRSIRRSTGNGSAQGQEKPLAVMFLDIRGFTARTADLLPYDVVFLLNRFFDAIVPEITKAGGTVDKYMGDGLLALFETGSPESSARAALRAATDIGRELAAFNDTLKSEGEPPVRIGIGLHLGEVVLGEIGAADHAPRTLIGATVNATSRLEAKTKELGVELLISRILIETAGHRLPDQDYQSHQLRGVDGPVAALALPRASELLHRLGEDAPPSQ